MSALPSSSALARLRAPTVASAARSRVSPTPAVTVGPVTRLVSSPVSTHSSSRLGSEPSFRLPTAASAARSRDRAARVTVGERKGGAHVSTETRGASSRSGAPAPFHRSIEAESALRSLQNNLAKARTSAGHRHPVDVGKPVKQSADSVREKGTTLETGKVKKAVRFAGELVSSVGRRLIPTKPVSVEEAGSIQDESCSLRSALKRPGALPKPPKQVRFEGQNDLAKAQASAGHHHSVNTGKPANQSADSVREKSTTLKTGTVKKAVRFASELVLSVGRCLISTKPVCAEKAGSIQDESRSLRSALKRPEALSKPPKQVRFKVEKDGSIQDESCPLRSALKRPGAPLKPEKQVRFKAWCAEKVGSIQDASRPLRSALKRPGALSMPPKQVRFEGEDWQEVEMWMKKGVNVWDEKDLTPPG